MSLDQDFDLNAAPLDPADDAEDEDAPEPQPLVIIQYRNRGFPPYLIPPTLVLLAAVVILSYQRQTPLRPLSPTQPTAPAVAEKPKPETPSLSSVLLPKEIVSAPAETKPKEPTALVSEPIVPSKDVVPAPAAKPAPEPKPAVIVASKEPERPAPEVGDPLVANEKLEPLEADPNPPKNAAPPASPPPAVAPPEPPKPPPVPASPFDLDPVEGLRKVKPARAAAEDAPGTANPEEALALARPAPARRTAIGFNLPSEAEAPEPEAPEPDPTPQPNPEVNKEEVEQDIQREAEEKQAERQELETIKSQAKLLEIKETVERAAAQRVPFRNELRRVLKTAPPEEAGKLIEDLCDEYGRETLPEIEDDVRRMLKGMRARSSRGDAVARMRHLGLPEPMILDYLAKGLHRQLFNSRGGPRTKDEVRVRAALLLLSFSTTPAKGTAPPSSPPATIGETTARAPQ